MSGGLYTRVPDMAETEYKVVEVTIVTDEELTDVINEWTGKGWTFDMMSFAMRDASKRPAMAFVLFTRKAVAGDTAGVAKGDGE